MGNNSKLAGYVSNSNKKPGNENTQIIISILPIIPKHDGVVFLNAALFLFGRFSSFFG